MFDMVFSGKRYSGAALLFSVFLGLSRNKHGIGVDDTIGAWEGVHTWKE